MRDSKLSFITNHIVHDSMLWNFFTDHFVRDGMRFLHTRWWRVEGFDMTGMTDLCQDVYVNRMRNTMEICGELDAATYLYLSVSRNDSITVTLARTVADDDEVENWMGEVLKIFPEAKPKDDRTIPVKFWMQGPRGAISQQRMISVPSWEEISDNYAEETAGGLAGVMNGFRPSHGGQLVLWHGLPGTGKTFAIRALGHHWKDWCDVECVVDPESFFGSAHYMMQVLMDLNGVDVPESEERHAWEGVHDLAKDGRWRLLVLEDAGELLAEDARMRTGQGLSRMLNLADGLIGQGLRTLVLVTTNEPLRSLHPAVSRPGRCAAEVEFEELSVVEAQGWLGQRSVQDEVISKPLTLADLYGRVEDFHGAQDHTQKVGFAR